MGDLQPTQGNIIGPRADLEQSEFDTLIFQKGRPVLFEKALQCPCKSPSTNQQTNCKNCGGSGWLFVNAEETRMIVQAVAISNDIKAWSEEARGTVNISCRSFERLTYMDRISLLDSQAIYNEVVFLKKSASDPTKYFSFLAYNVTDLIYIGLFKSINDKLVQIQKNQFTFERNIIKIDASVIEALTENKFSITVKYIHPPTFHIIEMRRETMESIILTGGTEKNQRFPVAAVGRRTHYILDVENLIGNRLLNNDYIEPKSCIIPGNT